MMKVGINMKLSLMSNDSELQNAIERTGYFQLSIINHLQDVESSQVIVISDQEMSYNELYLALDSKDSLIKEQLIFYLLTDFYNDHMINNLISLSSMKNITIIPPKLTTSQIVERVMEKTFPDRNETRRNIITFFGADNKVGTTMVAHSTAEMLSKNIKGNIALLLLSGKPSTCYIKRKEKIGLDDIKIKLMNNILTAEELIESCEKEDNHLYILPGVEDLLDIRHYHPEHIDRLIQLAAERFQVVIIDAGSNIDSGLSIAAINATKNKYLVVTQQETTRKNYERIDGQVFRRLQINASDFMLIVNKYLKSNHIYSAKQIADLYNMTLAAYIPHLEFLGWQAEFDHKTLLHYDNEPYNQTIEQLSQLIASQVHIPFLNKIEKKVGILKKAFSHIGGLL